MRRSSMFLQVLIIALVAFMTTPDFVQAEDLDDSIDLGFGATVSAEQLDDQSGGDATPVDKVYLQLSNVTIEGEVGNNALTSYDTGSNYLGGNAFADSSGLNTVFQVTGNMNVLQSSYTINVTLGD